MQNSTNYLKMKNLKDGYSYKIYARNAYIGVWIKEDSSFMISRYKCGRNPFVFYEFHWDSDERYGTVKPLMLIEKFPFKIKENYNDDEENEILAFLDQLEVDNPIISGVNTLQDRKTSAKQFQIRLEKGY